MSEEQMMVELKPCPFCGAAGDYLDADIITVSCTSCNAEGPPRQQGRGGVMTAEEQWNTRAILSTAGLVERFFIDHGMIHDRVTGKHVSAEPIEFAEGQFDQSPANELCALLNSLTARNKALEEALRYAAETTNDEHTARKLFAALNHQDNRQNGDDDAAG